jgi:putative membrane protein
VFALTSLPSVNATLNATSAVLLIVGYYHIRQGHQQAHRACMLAAFLVSMLFLVSYLVYHFHAGAIHFTGQGWIRSVYFALLISHTILAALVPFMALLTLSRALRQQFDRHRAMARWTLPIWLYVSVTGVVIYWLLYHVYAPA